MIKNQFIFGIEYCTDNYNGNTFENLYKQNNGEGSLQGNQLTESDQKRHFYNIFSQIRSLLSEKLELQFGLNYNETHFELTNFLPQKTAIEKFVDVIGIIISIYINDNLKVAISYAYFIIYNLNYLFKAGIR